MLKNYHRLIDSLELHEQSLLEDNLRQLKRNMQTGTQRLPWTSTNHEKFITVTSEVNEQIFLFSWQIKRKCFFFYLLSLYRNLIQQSIKLKKMLKIFIYFLMRFVSAIYFVNHHGILMVHLYIVE